MDSIRMCSEIDSRHVFVPSILEVRCNRRALKSFYNFKYGRPPAWQDSQSLQPSMVQADFCILPEIISRRNRPEPSQEHISFLEPGVAYFQRALPGGLCAELLFDNREALHPKLIANKVYDKWSNLRVAKSYFAPELTLSNILTVALLEAGFASLHCASLVKGDQGIFIWAPSNTGKTTTAWRLVSEMGYQFLGDDIAVTDGKRVYACPYTATGVPAGVGRSKHSMIERIRNIFYLSGWSRERLVDYLEPTSLGTDMVPTHIFLLTRGDKCIRPIARKEASNLLLRLNRLEFRYHFCDTLLLNSWNYFGKPDIQRCVNQEVLLIEKIVGQAGNIFQLSAPHPSDYIAQIRQIVEA